MMFNLLTFVAFFSVLILSCNTTTYVVDVDRVNKEKPLFNSQDGEQEFTYNYNPTFLPVYSDGKLTNYGIIVRSQDTDGTEYGTNPSVMTFAQLESEFLTPEELDFTTIKKDSVIFESQGEKESFGVEDPRVVYCEKNGMYYLLYSAVEKYQNGTVISRLALATATTSPTKAGGWTRRGPLFPEIGWSKSGALLIRDEAPHYLFFGDSSNHKGLQYAVSSDLFSYQIQEGIWLELREGKFDSYLVEAGPLPMKLSDGNYLLIYNAAKEHPSQKPGYNLIYQPGFVILDKDDPSKILQRSDSPIMTPTLGWETGDKPWLGLTPNVIFIEAMYPLGFDSFLVFYGAADSVVGAAVVTVSIE
ncbi:hypothetical protein M0813_23239 [Anaeramoeba flamelloides]|uniref:Uncharacterized protein n=1 Tax=Anaeramoeba flamelloides TaxID=1746091 RepID=A0ABQ8Y9I1_9EUKA|nr:hypothetical protein M0813_23239 [Anaeramoeba flamelloides]